MTGFDNLMRSQQFAQQSAMGYDQMRTGVAQNTNQMIVQGAQNFAQIQLQQKQLNSTVRLQQAEAQRQLSLSKLADMEIVDMTDMRRAQVKSMQHDEQLKALQVEDAKFRFEQMKGSAAADLDAKLFNDIDLKKMLEYGMVPKEGVIPKGVSDFRPGTDEEVEAYIQRSNRIGGGDRSGAEARYRANNARQAYNSLFARYYRNGRYFGPPEKQSEIERRMRELEGQFTGYFSDQGGSAGGYSGMEGTMGDTNPSTQPTDSAPPPVPIAGDEPGFKVDPFVEQMAGLGYQQMQQNPEWADLMGTMSDESKAGLLYGLGQAAADLVKNGLTTPEMAPGFVIEAASGTGTEAVYVLTMANFTEGRIRAILEGRGAPKERIDAVIKRVNDYVASRRRSK